MGRTIITHVGTSVLQCRSLKENNPSLDSIIKRATHADRRNGDLTPYVTQLCGTYEENLQRHWTNEGDFLTRRRAVAGEISSLSLLSITPDDRVMLVHSDTPKGRLSAALLKDMLTLDPQQGYPNCPTAEAKQIDGLKVPEATELATRQDHDDFIAIGLVNYVDTVWKAFLDQVEKPGRHEFILIITGGYKGMIPVARDMALILTDIASDINFDVEIRLCYLFDEGSELIWYGSYPIGLNWDLIRNQRANALDPMWQVLNRIVELRKDLIPQ